MDQINNNEQIVNPNELNTQSVSNSAHESVGFGNLYRKFYSPSANREHSIRKLNTKIILHYLFITFSLLGSIALIFFYAFPTYQKYQSSKVDLETAQKEYDKTHAQYQYLQGLSDFNEELDSNISLSKESIPVSEDIPQFMNQILKIAEEANVSLEKNDFLGIGASSISAPVAQNTAGEVALQPISTLKQITFSATISGNFDQIKKFFELIESSRRLTSIQNISMSEDEIGEDPTLEEIARFSSDEKIYSISFSCLGYFMQEPDLSSLKAEDFVQRGDFSNVFERIKLMKYYDLKEVPEEIGIEVIEDSTENNTNDETTNQNNNENKEELEEGTGISPD